MDEQTPQPSSPQPASDTRGRHSNPRYDYRSRSHDLAHAAAEAEPAVAIPQHPLISRAPASLINTAEAMGQLLVHLRQTGSFAYDSEFIGELSYHPKLCLIQVATHERVALIDTLADLDLAHFWELLADGSVEKIVHAGQQDLEPVLRHLKKPPANVFDTQVAAGFIALSYPAGLSKLVRELVGVQLGKGFTFTHWDQRPLSAVQMRYAADDVRYLPALRQSIGQKLAELGHVQWAQAECAALCDPTLYHTDPGNNYLRLRGGVALAAESGGAARAADLARVGRVQVRHASAQLCEG